MTVNMPHQGDCLFLQIWPKIKECSLPPGSACVSETKRPLKMYFGFVLSERWLFFMNFFSLLLCFWWEHNLCMVQWQQVSPRGGGEMSRAAASFLIWTEH